MSKIGCRKCSSPDCHGCNMFILFEAVRNGVFTPVMNKTMSIDIDLLKEKLAEHKTGKWEEKYITEEEWIRGAPSTVCPFCQKVNRNGKTPYCPHCGEKMEVDE